MRTIATPSSSNDTLRQSLAQEHPHTSAPTPSSSTNDDSELLDTLAQSVCTAIMAGNSAIVIATQPTTPALRPPQIAFHRSLHSRTSSHVSSSSTQKRPSPDSGRRPARLPPSSPRAFWVPIIAQLAANAAERAPAPLCSARWPPSSGNREATTPPSAREALEHTPRLLFRQYPLRLSHPPLRRRSAPIHPAAEICALHSRVIPPQAVIGRTSPTDHPLVNPLSHGKRNRSSLTRTLPALNAMNTPYPQENSPLVVWRTAKNPSASAILYRPDLNIR